MNKIPSLLAVVIILASSLGVDSFAGVRFSTYLGGADEDIPLCVAVDQSGNSYIAGAGGHAALPNSRSISNGKGAFIAKLNPDGSSVLYFREIGGFVPRSIAVDNLGQAYVAGYTTGESFPARGGFQSSSADKWDAVALKVTADGADLAYATYLGGHGDDAAMGIAVNRAGEVWVCGLTTSADFPVSGNAFQKSKSGASDAFLARISADGQKLDYSTFFGGVYGDSQAWSVALDYFGKPVICGRTTSPLFPTKNSFQANNRGMDDAFLAKFDESGQNLIFSTYLGGAGVDLAINVGVSDDYHYILVQGSTRSENFPTRNAFQNSLKGGNDLFVAKFTEDGSSQVFSTYIGSYNDDSPKDPRFRFGGAGARFERSGMAITPDGGAVLFGNTDASDYPVKYQDKMQQLVPGQDLVVTLFRPDGTVSYSSYLGGAGPEWMTGMAAAKDYKFMVVGSSSPAVFPPDFPTTPGVFQVTRPSHNTDGFAMNLSFSYLGDPTNSTVESALWSPTEVTFIQPLNEPDPRLRKSLWYRWIAPATGHAVFTSLSSSYSTEMRVFLKTAGGSLASRNPVINKNAHGESRGYAEAGEEFFIQVEVAGGGSVGTIVFSAQMSTPPNDDFRLPTPLNGTNIAIAASTIGATGEHYELRPRSVWWSWTAPMTGYFTVSTTGSDYDTGLAIYYPGELIEVLSPQAANSFYTNHLARATFKANQGVEYLLAVYAEDDVGGNLQLQLRPADGPSNDDFSNRTFLAGTNVVATASTFDTAYDFHEWATEFTYHLDVQTGQMLWWTWVSPIDGVAEISTAGSSLMIHPETLAATSILVFTGNPGDNKPPVLPEGAKIFFANPDDGTGPATLRLPEVSAGQHYNIGLDAAEGQHPVNLLLKITATALPRFIPGSSKIDGSMFKARAQGIAGRNYRLKASSNLVDWILVQNFPAVTGEFIIQSQPDSGFRFYRIESY